MTIRTITVGIAEDAIEQIAKVSLDRAIEELIWNALDAEATKVEVVFHENAAKGIEKVVVSDNGHGIPYDQAESIFKQIGGSPKKTRRRSPNLDRPYHGKEGKGRYKAFSLGQSLAWQSRILTKGTLQAFSITLRGSRLKKAEIASPEPCDGSSGCDVIVSEVCERIDRLRSAECVESLTLRLAPYLIANPGLRVWYDGALLSVKDYLHRDEIFSLTVEATDSAPELTAKLRVLEWTRQRKPILYYCDGHGVALDEGSPGVRDSRFPFTAYLLSDRLRQLHEHGLLLDELTPEFKELRELAARKLKDYVRQRQAEESVHIATRMRQDGLYPYASLPTSPVEQAEREVFDICAATVHEYIPDFEAADKNARRFTYRLLRETLEQNPSNLQTILMEVFRLTDEQQENLVGLLEKTSLGAIIHTAKTVTDRLSFINGLEQVLHERTIRKCVKERKQLHRILVEELWIFGDEFALGADDVSLRSVLQEHRRMLGLPDIIKQLTKPESEELDDIPDLLLWKQFLRGRNDEFEHLVIELKRPTVKISLDEIQQVKRYATKVIDNRYFDKAKTKWTFIAVSDDIANDALEDVSPRDRKPGHVHSGKMHDIWVFRWSEMIHQAKLRLKYVQDKLNVAVEDDAEGRAYLREKYAHLLPPEATNE
jgi:Histidine kinase-, DNA gyrase B-, and HSP90-like ATPase